MRAVPSLFELYPGICLTAEEKARKTLSQGSRRVPVPQRQIQRRLLLLLLLLLLLRHYSYSPWKPFASSLAASQQNIFLWDGVVAPRPTSNVEDQCIRFFVWAIAFGLSDRVGPISSYTNASISLRIIWITQAPLLRPSCDIKGGGRGACSRQNRWTRYKISEEASNDQKHVYGHFVTESVLKILNIPSHANKWYVKERIKQICYPHSLIPVKTLCVCKWYDFARLVLSIQ